MASNSGINQYRLVFQPAQVAIRHRNDDGLLTSYGKLEAARLKTLTAP